MERGRLLSKKEELKHFVLKHNIDIFLIQETKLITKDKTPSIKGYTITRKDRKQRKGSDNNRGGGLMIGIRNTIPYREIKLNIKEDDDDITEAMTIEIQIKNKRKIRITNVYIPPVRATESETTRQRRTNFQPINWPVKEYDCFFGDVNARSSLWDNTVL